MRCKKMDLKAYYERIGIEQPKILDRAALDRIILAHQSSIPFEDLDSCYLKKAISIDPETLFQKIVVNKRGGYCFEMNGLFRDLLVATGYDAYCCYCKVRGIERPVMHRGVFVRLEDGLYYGDVGFGGPMPAGSVKLEEGLRQEVDGETFWFDKYDDYWWNLKRLNSAGEEESIILMTTQPQSDIDFEAPNYMCCRNPEGRFTTVKLVNLKTKTGHLSITDDEFVIEENGQKTVKTIESDEEFRKILKESFQIEL